MVYKFYPLDKNNPGKTLVRNTETNEVFWQIKVDKTPPSVPSMCTVDYFYFKNEECHHIKNNRISDVSFAKVAPNTYQVLIRLYHALDFSSIIPYDLIIDYYSWMFKKIGIKKYKFDCMYPALPNHQEHLIRDPADGQVIGILSFSDDVNQAQFEFYFGDIIA